jgi:hypothetical protein
MFRAFDYLLFINLLVYLLPAQLIKSLLICVLLSKLQHEIVSIAWERVVIFKVFFNQLFLNR